MEESRVLKEVARIRNLCREYGHIYRNTREIVGPTLEICCTDMDPDIELIKIRGYYGDRFRERYDDELFHYGQLKYSLLHKVKEVKFFHSESLESRKIIIFSTDCISSIQYVKRGHDTTLLVHMRSSDIDALLPLDLWALCEILRAVNEEYCPEEDLTERVCVTIGSAHRYITGGRG